METIDPPAWELSEQRHVLYSLADAMGAAIPAETGGRGNLYSFAAVAAAMASPCGDSAKSGITVNVGALIR